MKLLKRSATVGFKSKKGSAYIESAMTMPMACLILIVLIGISMTFHGKLVSQIDQHKKYFEEKKYAAKMEVVRLYESPF